MADDTIIALATPPGESALAVIRLSGPDAIALATAAFRRDSNPPAARRITLGQLRAPSARILDSCLFVLFPDTASYTGEPSAEIFSHGNPLIINAILDSFVERGARLAEPGEFTRRSFLNGKIDLSQAEAVLETIHARSERALQAAQQQLSGETGRRVDDYVDQITEFQAQIEAYIDFPEDDLPPEDQQALQIGLQALAQSMEAFARTADFHTMLQHGIDTVIIGAPNAGKSTLLNFLLGEDRAIVSERPGTTRDFLRESIPLPPYHLNLIDTAGVHDTSDEIELAGIRRTVAQLESAGLVLLIVDASQPFPDLSQDVLDLVDRHPALLIKNKIDLPVYPDAPPCPALPSLEISLKTGAGVPDLLPTIRELIERDRVVPRSDEALANQRHAQILKRAAKDLREALGLLESEQAVELVANHTQAAIAALGEIVGHIDNEAVLDRLFAKFCIGK